MLEPLRLGSDMDIDMNMDDSLELTAPGGWGKASIEGISGRSGGKVRTPNEFGRKLVEGEQERGMGCGGHCGPLDDGVG